MIRLIIRITLILFWGVAPLVKGQMVRPVKISLFNEATTIPFTQAFTTPIHPGIQGGTEFKMKESLHHQLVFAINVGYIFHKHLYQGIYINTELGYDYKFKFGLNLKTALGIGYLHTFGTQQEFQFKDGQYQSKSDGGNWRTMPSFTFGCGYRLKKSIVTSPEVFILYQTWVEYPYSPGFIPVMTHTNLHVGTKFFLPTLKK